MTRKTGGKIMKRRERMIWRAGGEKSLRHERGMKKKDAGRRLHDGSRK